ncbi:MULTISPECIES: hypothetical protein [unclassified Microcoleus]
MLEINQFEVVSFDCYGTLIDWARGKTVQLMFFLSLRALGEA